MQHSEFLRIPPSLDPQNSRVNTVTIYTGLFGLTSPSGIRLKSWLIIIGVRPILFCSTKAPAINWSAKRVCKEWKVEASRALWVEWWAKACKLCLFGILSECKTGLKISACHDCKYRRITHSLWQMVVKCLLRAGKIRRPKTRWVTYCKSFIQYPPMA